MSPIRASERARYPANWADIRAAIIERADDRCECDGRCESPHCHAFKVLLGDGRRTRCRARHSHSHPSTGSTVILTVAHLDHTPENNDPSNLLAMCQACHNAYDADHRKETRRATRLARLAQQ